MKAKKPIDISPVRLKRDVDAVREILDLHLIPDGLEIDGIGPASYGIARYIAKRLAEATKK